MEPVFAQNKIKVERNHYSQADKINPDSPSIWEQADTYTEKAVLTALFVLDKGTFFISPLRWLFPTSSDDGQRLEGGLVNCQAEALAVYQENPAEAVPSQQTPAETVSVESEPEICDEKDNDGDTIIDNIPIRITSLVRQEPEGLDVSFPQWSPQGDRIVFVKREWVGGRPAIYSMKPDGSDEKLLLDNAECFSWTEDTSELVFYQFLETGGRLLIGDPPQEVMRFWYQETESMPLWSCPLPGSQSEDIRFATPCSSPYDFNGFKVESLNPNTKKVRTLADFCQTASPWMYFVYAYHAYFSPDHQKLVLFDDYIPSERNKLYLLNLDDSSIKILAEDSPDFRIINPILWLPDNRRLIFTSLNGFVWETWLLDTKTGDKELLKDQQGNPMGGGLESISPGGEYLLHYHYSGEPMELFSLNILKGTDFLYHGYLSPIFSSGLYKNNVGWSHDGRWMVVSGDINIFHLRSALTLIELPCPDTLNAPPVWTRDE